MLTGNEESTGRLDKTVSGSRIPRNTYTPSSLTYGDVAEVGACACLRGRGSTAPSEFEKDRALLSKDVSGCCVARLARRRGELGRGSCRSSTSYLQSFVANPSRRRQGTLASTGRSGSRRSVKLGLEVPTRVLAWVPEDGLVVARRFVVARLWVSRRKRLKFQRASTSSTRCWTIRETR